MSRRTTRPWQKATTLLPLALLSAAATASIVGVGGGTVPVADSQLGSTLPDGTSVPAQAIEVPASLSAPDGASLGLGGESATQVVSDAQSAAIPSAALAAYQRSETVINAADDGCHLQWQLVAAIGRVESDHGRYAGSALDANGVATPPIYGLALDGTNGTQHITDTDAGQYDADTTYDRAVGPMQFIPSTWSVVGVDADGDGQRNPQDVDDAALATAVYLCSGEDDLATDAGRRSAVFRYNHSQSYVDLVLAIMDAYLAGDFSSYPGGASGEPGTTLAGGAPEQPRVSEPPATTLTAVPGSGSSSSPSASPTRPPKPTRTPTPTAPPTTAPPATTPTGGGNGGGGNGGGGGGNGGGNGGGSAPTQTPSVPALPTITLPPLPSTSIPPVDGLLTVAQATVQCTLEGLSSLLNPQRFQECVNRYTGQTPNP